MPYNDPHPNFDAALDRTLRRRGDAPASGGLEQRLAAALLNAQDLAPQPKLQEPRMATLVSPLPNPVFRTAEALRGPRSRASIWSAVALHAAVILLIGIAVMAQTRVTVTLRPIPEAVVLNMPAPPPPIVPHTTLAGGGGGHHDPAPASAGHLPKPSLQPLVPLEAQRVDQPRLAAEPSIVVQSDLKIADSHLPNLGAPDSHLPGASLGNGLGNGIGVGSGSGYGPGAGGNTGGGMVYRIGGGVSRPVVIHAVDPEFSEEARRTKFSGNVIVYLQIDEQGVPDHIRVVRGVGMGLDEKAVEAARQYRFKPGMKDGKPVRTWMYMDVNFNIF
jgi:periplasmic protein TonB